MHDKHPWTATVWNCLVLHEDSVSRLCVYGEWDWKRTQFPYKHIYIFTAWGVRTKALLVFSNFTNWENVTIHVYVVALHWHCWWHMHIMIVSPSCVRSFLAVYLQLQTQSLPCWLLSDSTWLRVDWIKLWIKLLNTFFTSTFSVKADSIPAKLPPLDMHVHCVSGAPGIKSHWRSSLVRLAKTTGCNVPKNKRWIFDF